MRHNEHGLASYFSTLNRTLEPLVFNVDPVFLDSLPLDTGTIQRPDDAGIVTALAADLGEPSDNQRLLFTIHHLDDTETPYAVNVWYLQDITSHPFRKPHTSFVRVMPEVRNIDSPYRHGMLVRTLGILMGKLDAGEIRHVRTTRFRAYGLRIIQEQIAAIQETELPATMQRGLESKQS